MKGPSSPTVCRVVHRVANCLMTLKDDLIKFPEDCSKLASDFFKIAGFPSVAGCLDGCHICVIPNLDDQPEFINRHHQYSINMLGVAGPKLQFFYVNTNFGGRSHDSHVLKQSSLWHQFENCGARPFPGNFIFSDLL